MLELKLLRRNSDRIVYRVRNFRQNIHADNAPYFSNIIYTYELWLHLPTVFFLLISWQALEKDDTFIIFHAVVGFVGDNMNDTAGDDDDGKQQLPTSRLAKKRVSHKLRLYFIGIRRQTIVTAHQQQWETKKNVNGELGIELSNE